MPCFPGRVDALAMLFLSLETIHAMKLAGFLLLLAGWGLVLSAVALLTPMGSRASFALAGFTVQLLGLILVIRAHLPPREEDRG
jgi:hypothetical protein